MEIAKHKGKYLEPKKKVRGTVYQAKCKAEGNRFGNVMWQDDQKSDLFKTTKRMVKTNQNVICELYVKNDDGVLEVNNEDKKIAWKSYHEKLSITESAWNKNTLSHERYS